LKQRVLSMSRTIWTICFKVDIKQIYLCFSCWPQIIVDRFLHTLFQPFRECVHKSMGILGNSCRCGVGSGKCKERDPAMSAVIVSFVQ
jgi:hypothetical protein